MSRRSRLRRRTRSSAPRVIVGALALTVVMSLLASGTGVAVAVGIASSWLEGLPDINDPDAFNVAQTTKIYSADGVLLANLYLENRQVVPLEDISPHLLHAVVAVEDERFYQHNGVDFIGLTRAVVTNVTTGRREGASTLTQQFIRNTVLADERFDISIKRKVREAWLALELEKTHSKDEILAMYLNTVYYGEGAYGAEAASLTYFNKHASELTVAEAALLAGLPQAPSRLTPYDNPDGAVSRRQWVLSKLFEQGYVSSDEYEAAKIEDLRLARSSELDEQGVYKAPYFVAHVKKLLQDEYGTSLVFKGGLTVHTTLDTTMQTYAEEASRSVLDRADDPDNALVAIEPSTGYIKALVGGRDWNTNKFNFATQAHRQPGSSFKVFTLVTALEEGMPPRRMLDSSSPAIIPTGGRPWNVGNAEGGGGRGYITLQSATVGSVNTAFARLIAEIGAEKVVLTARRMGIESDIQPFLSITLGSQEVTPLEMASAFGTLAADGRHFPHTAITKIIDAQGEIVFEDVPEGDQVIEHSVAYAATQILKGVISGGTARRAAIGRPAAGKTGTTQDYRDAWFVGYTPDLACAVWMGYTPERPMRSVHGRRVFGGTFPAEIWQKFMCQAIANTPKNDFNPAPAPKYTWMKEWDIHSKSVPNLAGLTQAAAIQALEDAGFEDYEITSTYHDTIKSGLVASQTPAAGSKVDPAKTVVQIAISKGPDPNKPKPPPPAPPPDPEPEPKPDPEPEPTSTPTP
ncbi:MAG: PBP1A family penicillin-binding protein [Actinomycetota bacterium]|nr:PBP1A family penicillin-binding protein [Actinomycetota bacterium]